MVLPLVPLLAGAASPCTDGRYLLPGEGPLVTGAATPAIEAVVLDGGAVALASGCPPAMAKLRAKRRGTKVHVVWPKGVCAGAPRKIRLTGRIDPTCTELRGKVTIKKRRRRFTARLSTCGDGILDREGGEACALLEGPDDAPAIDATIDLDAPTPIPPEANDVDALGRALVRTRIEVVFTNDATVGAVNAIISELGGRIVSMLEGVPSVVLDIPDPGSVGALDAIVTTLSGDPVVRLVLQATEPVPDALPPNYTIPLAGVAAARIDHQVAIRAPAAWNGRAAIVQPPTVAVLDYFGDGTPNADFDLVTSSPSDFSSAGQGDDGDHGYHVLGIITGRFGGASTDRGQVTGIFPGTTVARVVDIQDPSTDFLTEQNRALQRLRSGTPHGILNTSLGNSCFEAPLTVALDGAWWAEKVRTSGLEGRILQVTSAGNVKSTCPGETDALTNSDYAAAALLPLSVPNLTNVLVVENVVNGSGPGFEPCGLSTDSKLPGDLAGIGTSVFSFTNAQTAAGNLSGTSMATPQVAGLAAYLWALEPSMTVQDVRDTLLATASAAVSGSGPGCSLVASAPVIDAYAAVLSLDGAALPNPANAPIRQAILDVDDSGRFDDADVAAFVDALVDPLTGDPREPTQPDFGRHDLNGDGFTGGAQRTGRFDLDRVDSVRFGPAGHGVVVQTISGADVSFDEDRLTDLDILCYYAYSDLYEGTPASRDTLLGLARCARARVSLAAPSQLEVGVAAPLTVEASVVAPDGTGATPLPGALVHLVATGGLLGVADAVTDGNGRVQTTVTAAGGITSVDVQVELRDPVTAAVLAQASATIPVVDISPLSFTVDVFTGFAEATGAANVSSLVNGQPMDDEASYLDRTDAEPFTAAGSDQAAVIGASASFSSNANLQFFSQVSGDTVTVTGSATAHADDTFEYGADAGGCSGATAQTQASIRIHPSDPTIPLRLTIDGTLAATVEPSSHLGAVGASGFFHSTVTGNFETENLTGGMTTSPFTFEDEVSGDLVAAMLATAVANPSCFNDPAMEQVSADMTVSFTLTLARAGASTSTSTSTTTSTSSSSSSSTTTPSSTTTTTMTPGGGRDAYRLYDATGPDAPEVALVDRFRSETVDLGSALFFLAPAGLDGVPVSGATSAQTCYAYPGAVFTGSADVIHVLGSQLLTLGDPVALCTPSIPLAVPVDHYACHVASGSSLDASHLVEDEFQSQTVQVLAPAMLCVPAGVDGSAVVDPFTAFVCYATDPAGSAVGTVGVTNAFQAGPIDVGMPIGVCVPATASTAP